MIHPGSCAGFLDHTDVQIDRLIDFLQKIEVLDGTIVISVSESGASEEAGISRATQT